MNRYYYKKGGYKLKKKVLRIISLVCFLLGGGVLIYIFFPLILWQIYFFRSLSSQNVTAPIPRNTVIDSTSVTSLISAAANSLSGVDYTNAKNWFPNLAYGASNAKVPSYLISIPKINVANAEVTTQDNDLSIHLVNYPGTGIPGDNGNAVIFGHSTLPSLFNPKDYKTIFAYAHTLKVGDIITAKVNGASYSYKIFNISVVDSTDTSALAQTYDDSYITLVTCTPPGTIWKRLIIKARLEKL